MNESRTACVIGWPVAHSRSPAVIRFWLDAMDISGNYVPVAVEPDRIADFLKDFVSSGYLGGNVTVPHKEAAFAAVADMGAAARAIGAVNTLWIEGGKLLGENTDSIGFLANLDDSVENWDNNPGAAVVLGAGGAARAVLFGLLKRGFAPIYLVNRTIERAEALVERFGNGVKATSWQQVEGFLGEAKLLVNTTTLGMAGTDSPNLDLAALPDDAIVNDLVYVPLETPLLAAARARGLSAVDGLGMLLHQAVPGFERWFGVRPIVTPELRAAIVKTLEA